MSSELKDWIVIGSENEEYHFTNCILEVVESEHNTCLRINDENQTTRAFFKEWSSFHLNMKSK